MIRNPETGGCVSRYGPTGKALAMAKKYEDAQKFISAYNQANRSATGGYKNHMTYTSRFNNPQIIAARNQRHAEQVEAMQARSRTMGLERSGRVATSAGQKSWGETFSRFFKPSVL